MVNMTSQSHMLLFSFCAGEGALDFIRAAQSVQPGEGQCHVTVKRLRLL